jgi:hypothetical protein
MGREKVDTGDVTKQNDPISTTLRMELLNQLGDPEQGVGVTNYWILKKMKVKVLLKISSKWRTKNRSSG